MHRTALADNGCWEWRGGQTHNGYGHVRGSDGKTKLTHRVTFEHVNGPVPDGFYIDHLCRVRHCVNPDHMEVVTTQENTARAVRPVKTHCKHGHELTPENTIVRSASGRNDFRVCLTCSRKWRSKS